MALIPLKTNPTRRELRQFAGIWLPIFWFAVAAIMWSKQSAPALVACAAVAGLVIGVIGWRRPDWFRPLFVGWMFAVYPIGWVVSNALLAILYYGLITPIGWAMRLAGRDPMQRRFDRQADTYWQAHSPPANDSNYYRQY